MRTQLLAPVFVCLSWCLCVPLVRAASDDAPTAGDQAAPSVVKTEMKRFYINSTYLAKAYNASSQGRRFIVQGEGELSLELYKVQFNLDLQVSSDRADPEISVASPSQSDFIVEQAYFNAPLLPDLALMGGVLHNPLGFEGEDAPDRDQVSHGQIWNLINGQTHLPGNSVQGVALNGGFGRTGLFLAFLNDLGQVRNRHSVELLLTSHPVQGLKLEGGFLTQSSLTSNPASAETLFDVNGGWQGRHVAAAVEYFAGDKLINSAWGGYGRLGWGRFFLAARGDWVRYLIPNVQDTTTLTLTGAFVLNDKFKLALEYRLNHNTNTVPVVLTLPDNGSSVRLQALIVI